MGGEGRVAEMKSKEKVREGEVLRRRRRGGRRDQGNEKKIKQLQIRG